MNFEKIFSFFLRSVLFFIFFFFFYHFSFYFLSNFYNPEWDNRLLSNKIFIYAFFNPIYMLNIGFLFNTELGQQFLSSNVLVDDLTFNFAWYNYNQKYPFHLTLFGFFPEFLNFNFFFFFDKPIFFYFGVLFFFTTISSFLFFNFLGLYGVFYINLISLFLF
jgi:hypothetical protein